MTVGSAHFGAVPPALAEPLVREYSELLAHYLARKWGPSEVHAGRFCEVVYTILHGYIGSSYAPAPQKPANFPEACKQLENAPGIIPRSLRILIPRMLPPLYEIRNNRNAGHVGGDVDSSAMDAGVCVSMCSWIIAELVRVLHGLPTLSAAEQIVATIVERPTPAVWTRGSVRRVLPSLSRRDQVLLLLYSSAAAPDVSSLLKWTEVSRKDNLTALLRAMHKERLIEIDVGDGLVHLLPAGSKRIIDEVLPAIGGQIR
jgi:hypothetical protein